MRESNPERDEPKRINWLHTCQRDLVVGPVVAEVVDRRARHAPLKAKHLVSRANQNPFDPLCTDASCCCFVEELRSIYRQMKEDWENQNIRVDSHGLMGD
jgi:hypothetical protein